MTLINLQASTQQDPKSSGFKEEYVPQDDLSEASRFADSHPGFTDVMDYSNDLSDAGIGTIGEPD
jgi:hypothetical protein